MEAVDVVEEPVIGLGRHRQREIVVVAFGEKIYGPLDRYISGNAAGMGVGDGDRQRHLAGFLDVMGAAQLAIAIEAEKAGEQRLIDLGKRSRHDCGHAGANRTRALLERAVAFNDRAIADRDARHIGDGVERPADAFERQAEALAAELA